MKVSNLVISTTTRMKVRAADGGPLLDENDDPDDVYIVGHTSDTKEYRKAAQRIFKSDKPQKMFIGKKGRREIEQQNDPLIYEKSIRLLASVVTDIEGITEDENGNPWAFSTENVTRLFLNDGCAYIVEQWGEHLDDRKNFLDSSETSAPSGSELSPG